jgi:hypothetical protein
MSMSGNGSGLGSPTPEEAVAAATEFIEAVVWGEHHKVWSLLGAAGRDEVLEVATKRGMDEGLAGRLRAGTGSESETNEFLADLVNGLRSELAGNDLDHITYEVNAAALADGKAVVTMHVPLHPNLGGTLPIGTLEMSTVDGGWHIERLIPLTSK